MTSITKLTPTPEYNPAVGRIFIIELSNGERFETNYEDLVSAYCYSPDFGYDDEKIDRLVVNNFQELVGESWKSE
jgi:hypothetical protein